jgi:hypothetical protein
MRRRDVGNQPISVESSDYVFLVNLTNTAVKRMELEN